MMSIFKIIPLTLILCIASLTYSVSSFGKSPQKSKIQNNQKTTKSKRCDPNHLVCIDVTSKGEHVYSEIYNNTFHTITVEVKLWSKNALIEHHQKDITNIILSGKERKKLTSLQRANPLKSFGYNFFFTSKQGKLDATHDDSYIYDLPFETGKSYKLLQGYGGNFSHRDSHNYYAYDFKMPNRSLITAAREGIVIKTVSHFSEGGTVARLANKDNHIHIEHNDGTIAVYSHLQHDGIIVKEGDKVQKGQNIGYSGSTGYLDTPHLHFAVFKFTKNQIIQSLPIKIKTRSGTLTKLQKYEEYTKP